MRMGSATRLGAAASGGTVHTAAAAVPPSAAVPALPQVPASVSGPGFQIVFVHGDRISGGCVSPLVARLQQPQEVAAVLDVKFPGAGIHVVMPERYEGDYALYDSWLAGPPPPPARQGVPAHFLADGFPAVRQLHRLVAGGDAAALSPPCRVVLLGFSKACVVLHQVLVELAAWQKAAGAGCAVCAWEQQRRDEQQQQQQQQQQARQDAAASTAALGPPWCGVLPCLQEMHWLDAGANWRGTAYPASPELLALLARRCPRHALRLHLHGTPRQWHDRERRWLGQEAAGMAAACVAAGLQHSRRLYFDGEPPSLAQHFSVIQAFEPEPAAT